MDKKFTSLEEMQEKLEQFGSKEIWRRIENIANPFDRIIMRQIFFNAGGTLE
jgi:ADP-dependent phosphofructokinase/glucokinase